MVCGPAVCGEALRAHAETHEKYSGIRQRGSGMGFQKDIKDVVNFIFLFSFRSLLHLLFFTDR